MQVITYADCEEDNGFFLIVHKINDICVMSRRVVALCSVVRSVATLPRAEIHLLMNYSWTIKSNLFTSSTSTFTHERSRVYV